MRIVHLSDVHLDRPFAGLERETARRRRQELRDAFERSLIVARDRQADLITIGGDLWEDEHVTGDTRRFVAHALGRAGVPVIAICGNHDPWLPGGHYARTEWPANVQIVGPGPASERHFADVSIWAVGWGGGRADLSWLTSFAVPGDGRAHLLLLHGSACGNAYMNAGSGEPHGPFDPAAISRCGFALCLAGHYHSASFVDPVVYPGSPEPLGWGDTGRHAVAVIEILRDGASVELLDVNLRRYVERSVICDGLASSAEIADQLALLLNDPDPTRVCVRVTLTGQVATDCRIETDALSEPYRSRYAALALVDRTTPAFDYDALGRQETATGHFVRTLRQRLADESDEDRRQALSVALDAGLHALAGREQVARVD